MSGENPSTQDGTVLHGIGVSPGLVIGPVLLWQTEADLVAEYDVSLSEVEAEIVRFRQALEKTRTQIHDLQQKVTEIVGEDVAQIFEAHILLVDDKALVDEVVAGIQKDRKNAEFVLMRVAGKVSAALRAVDDDYLRDRAADIRDVTRRILQNLGGGLIQSLGQRDHSCIVVATDLMPSETASLHTDQILGIVTDLGSKTSHSAIMARAMEIPALVGMGDVSSWVRPEDTLLIDGTRGMLIINPSAEQVREAEERESSRLGITQRLESLRDLPAETTDAYQILLAANIEFPAEMDSVIKYGAGGVGLYRTEYLYVASDELPDETVQFNAYEEIARRLAPRPAVIRTLDLGGDKFSGQVKTPAESNPFMGWRAIRFCLDQPALFRTQLRAVLRASVLGNVKLMYPMVSNAEEVRRANDLLEHVKDELDREGIPFQRDLEVGIMIEVPSAALTAELFVDHVGFFSIGTNDLVQYTMAVDRVNERVAHLYEPTHPAILKLIRHTIDIGHAHDIWISVCGQMAAHPALALLLMGMGVDELSVTPPAVPLVKSVIRNVTYGQVETLAEEAMECVDGDQVLDSCLALLRETSPDVLELL